jgi:hypothetical protein
MQNDLINNVQKIINLARFAYKVGNIIALGF